MDKTPLDFPSNAHKNQLGYVPRHEGEDHKSLDSFGSICKPGCQQPCLLCASNLFPNSMVPDHHMNLDSWFTVKTLKIETAGSTELAEIDLNLEMKFLLSDLLYRCTIFLQV